MKTYKSVLHLWITFVSLLSFLIGWAMLAHAPKPAQPSQHQNNAASFAPLPTLAPIQGFGSNANPGNALGFFSVNSNPQPVTRSSPFLRTGGS